jgi:ribosome-binding factor A
MKLSQLKNAQIRQLCADWDEEDGVRPEKRRERRKKDFKPLKLCRQAEKALAFEWDELTDRRITAGMAIEKITPEDNGSKLVVHVVYDAKRYISHQIVMHALKERRGYLRFIIAGMIHRKRVPDLAFEVRPGGDYA